MALRRTRGLWRHPRSAGQCAYEHMSQTETTFPQMTSPDCTTASHTQDHRQCHCFHGIDPQPAASRARLFRSTWLHVCTPRWPRWDGSARPCRVKLLQLDNKQANWSLFLASGDEEREREGLRKHILEVGWAGKRLSLVVAHGEFWCGKTRRPLIELYAHT